MMCRLLSRSYILRRIAVFCGGMVAVGFMLLIFGGCAGAMQRMVLNYMAARWNRIETIQAHAEVKLGDYPAPFEGDFYYKKRERVKLSVHKPDSLRGSYLILNQGAYFAYNVVTNSAIYVSNIPLMKSHEKWIMVQRVMGRNRDRIRFRKREQTRWANRRVDKYLIRTFVPEEHRHYVWVDDYYFFPLRAIFVDPDTRETNAFSINTIAYNEAIDDGVFDIPDSIPNVPIIRFDMDELAEDDKIKFLPPPPEDFELKGVVRDQNDTDWILADYSVRPNILYVISSASNKPPMPSTGVEQSFEVNGHRAYRILAPGYAISRFTKAGRHFMLVSNMSFEQMREWMEEQLGSSQKASKRL